MPRAFDRRQLGIDRDPLRSILPELSKLPSLEIPDIFAVCDQPFINGLKLLGTGEGELSKIATGIQSVIDTLFGTLFCNADTGLTPQTMFGALGDLLEPILASPFVQGLVELADWLGRATGTFLGDVFAGLIGLVDWVCGILTCNPAAEGTTPQSLIDGFQAVLDPILANPFIQGIIAWANEVGVAVGNFALDIFNGILAMVEALCSLVTTGALPTTYGTWANTPAQIIADITGLIEVLLDNPITAGLSDLIAGTGNLLYDTVAGLSQFITELTGLLGIVAGGPQAILDFLSGEFGADGLLGFINTLPIIGPLVSKLTGFDSSGDTALDLATLGNWAKNLLTTTGNIPADRLIGSLPEAIFATLPVSSISFTAGNLLAQGAFANANTVEAAGGWSWDADTTATGAGGALKATATGAAQQIYSRQTIKIAAGDRVDVAAKVKTAGFTSGSMTLAVIPWIGTAAQPAQIINTRTASAATFAAGLMSGPRLRFGGTAEAGEVLMSASITAITVRLAVTANAGAEVWFDDVSVRKAGALAQTLVEYLTTTWEQTWNAVFGAGGVGKQWFDFVTAVSQIFTTAGLGVSRGDTANGNALGIIDSIGKAVFGEATFQNLPGQVKSSMQFFIGKLFGFNVVQDKLTGTVIPGLDGSVITGGTVDSGFIDVDGVGAAINPTAGSGALLSRVATNPAAVSGGRNVIPNGFFNTLSVASNDIQCLRTDGSAGTGFFLDYAGAFRVTIAGWYMVEICYRLNVGFGTGAVNAAPVLFKGNSLANAALAGSAFKVGTDSCYRYLGTTDSAMRFVQNSYIVYLNANDVVRAGLDLAFFGVSPTLGGQSGTGTSATETYFSISLLNKSYA